MDSSFNHNKSSKIRTTLAVRLSVWFLILSTLPLIMMMGYIRGNFANQLNQIEIENEQRKTKELALFISQQSIDINLLHVLQSSASPNKHYYIISSDGNIQFSSDVYSERDDIPYIDYSALLEEINTQYNGFMFNAEKNELITFTPIPLKNVFLVCIHQNTPIFALVNKLENQFVLQLGVSLVLISLIAGFIIWFIIGQPIKELTQAAIQIREGNFGTTVNTETMSDELLVMANAFNQMSAMLQETILGLENNLMELEEAHETIRNSETRYSSIFDTVPVSIWEEDITELIQIFETLKKEGVTDLRKYIDENPDFLFKAVSAIKVLNVNAQTVAAYHVKSKEALLGSLGKIFNPQTTNPIKNELVAIFNGATSYETELTNITKDGKKIETIMRLTIPELNSPQKKMLVSMMDISEQKRATEEIKLAYENTLKGWSSALELHDHETFGHSDRVTKLTVALAKNMGIPADQLIHIQRGAILHDIGKMGIPDSILNKSEQLSKNDWERVRNHPVYAKKLLESIDYLKPATDIPYYHHEWWNGGGYPEGLERENIPFAARLFAVIDVWDALSNPRPYREAWPEEKVLQYIQDLSGIQFDPLVVEAFSSMIREKKEG